MGIFQSSNMELKALTKQELHERTQQFCDLYHSCFNDKIDATIIEQRYLQNPVGDLCMYVAMEDDRIVANYSVSPALLQIGDKQIKCALSLNTMTHPDFIGKGLFVELAKRLYGELKQQGYGMVYGFPNYISNRTFCTKLGWKDIYEIPTLELVVEKELPFNSSNIVASSSFDVQTETDVQLTVAKYEAYLNWRYKNKPYTEYNMVKTANGSWMVYKRYQNMINIVELHPENVEDLTDLIGYVSSVVKELGLEKMTVWSDINSWIHLVLEKLGFRNRYPITYFGACDLNMPKELDIGDFRNWNIQMGDDNVY